MEETVDSSDEDDNYGSSATKKANKDLQYIQMVSALVLQMIQAIAQIPPSRQYKDLQYEDEEENGEQKKLEDTKKVRSA